VDIAEEAGVAVGTLYHHFRDKQGLLRAILFETLHSVLGQLEAADVEPVEDNTEHAERWMQGSVAFWAQKPQWIQLLVQSDVMGTRAGQELIETLMNWSEQRMIVAQAQGRFDPDLSPKIATRALVGMWMSVATWWVRDSSVATPEEIISTISRIRTKGVLPEGPA
jgi:AcrR family transcriptional regulator